VGSVDVLSGGGFLFCMGAGWNFGSDARPTHGAVAAVFVMWERIEAMNAIWTEDEASYSGRHVGLERIWCRRPCRGASAACRETDCCGREYIFDLAGPDD
jgi:alkanesulfonate monooxygenase SsuD/methylene tetrahydromethanopterin reductase-like flavin-dependent oxidoreductase (luciferase family)